MWLIAKRYFQKPIRSILPVFFCNFAPTKQNSMINWFEETFLQPTMVQAVTMISIVSAVGLYLGRIKFFGVSLGITFVFFAGILAGHLGVVVHKDMLLFAQSFGLIIFVYTLGLQVGPSFFSSLKEGGVILNSLSITM